MQVLEDALSHWPSEEEITELEERKESCFIFLCALEKKIAKLFKIKGKNWEANSSFKSWADWGKFLNPQSLLPTHELYTVYIGLYRFSYTHELNLYTV